MFLKPVIGVGELWDILPTVPLPGIHSFTLFKHNATRPHSLYILAIFQDKALLAPEIMSMEGTIFHSLCARTHTKSTNGTLD